MTMQGCHKTIFLVKNFWCCGRNCFLFPYSDNTTTSGGQFLKAKDFDNVVHRSLLEILGSALIIDVITPMELHLILGIVNYLFQQLQSIWPQSKEVAKRLHIQEQPYHGCHFVRNDCHKIPSLSLKEYTLCFTMPNILSEEKKPLWDSTVSKQLRLCI